MRIFPSDNPQRFLVLIIPFLIFILISPIYIIIDDYLFFQKATKTKAVVEYNKALEKEMFPPFWPTSDIRKWNTFREFYPVLIFKTLENEEIIAVLKERDRLFTKETLDDLLYKRGDIISIYYNPDNPQDIRLKNSLNKNDFFYIIFFTISILFIFTMTYKIIKLDIKR
jgi:hypothetical protein